MSDHEDDYATRDDVPGDVEEDAVDDAMDEDGDGLPPPRRGKYDDDDDDEEEEEEEEEEDEEEDGAGENGPSRKRAKRRKRPAINRFLDVEAEVDEDDEEEEEDEEFNADGFIAEPGFDEEDSARRSTHARLRDRDFDERPEDLSKIAEEFAQRYKQSAPTRYTGDMNDIPQRLLMPSVHDANLWQVRCKPGKERELVMSLMRKFLDLEYSGRPLNILSAFQRDSLPGMIYVEARSSKQVSEACNGLVGIYPSRGVSLVPIEEMASLLLIKKQEQTVTPGSWVRIRRGKYAGDLAQVMDITENGEEVGLKFIPRIDLNPKEESVLDGKKRKKIGAAVLTGALRPPQRFFNFEEVAKAYNRKSIAKRNQVFVFQNDTYKDGFIEKDFRLSQIELEDVNPTLDEITMFARGQDGGDNESAVDLSIIAEAARKAAIAVLQPGDHIEVFEGEQAGVHGIVQSVAGDIVTISASGMDLDGQKVDLPARSVRKRFKPGDHVKVMTGKNVDETGLVVSVTDNVVTFLSDMSMMEVSVFSKDLREAAEVGSSTNIVGNYELHDLVQLDVQTVGVIFKTERDSFRVLDQNGQVRLVKPHQIQLRRDSHRAIATDSTGHELHVNDNVKEVEGEARKGRVVHLHQAHFAFLHNRDIAENGGIFVTRCRYLASLAPKGNIIRPGVDTTKMNPAMMGGAGGMVGSGMGRGPRDFLIGVQVTVIKGNYKGYIGVVKDTNGAMARVEVQSKNKVVTIEKDKLRRRAPNGGLENLESSSSRPSGFGTNQSGGWGGSAGNAQGRTPNPYAQGHATPGWGMGRTPNPYADNGGKTPAWNANSRTPNPYAAAAGGGKTPAWNASSRTPNPYAAGGGKTPAWDAGARTPNPYAAGAGGGGGWGGATPGRPTSSSWGGSGNDSWGNSSGDAWGAPPAAPTPAAYTGAPTPAAYAAAPTPGEYHSAPTPGAGGYGGYGAPTPAASFAGNGMSAPTPAAGFGESSPSTEIPVDDDPLWLINFSHENKRGLMVVIKGSDRPSPELPNGFWNGKFEGHQGNVLTASKTALSAGGTITLRMLSGDEINPPPSVVKPVTPERPDQFCMVLRGPARGMTVQLVSQIDDKWFVMREGGAYDEIPTENMCVWDDLSSGA